MRIMASSFDCFSAVMARTTRRATTETAVTSRLPPTYSLAESLFCTVDGSAGGDTCGRKE